MKLEMVDLSGCERLMPAELSGGMLKRAALARAVVMDPKLSKSSLSIFFLFSG